MIRNSRRLRWLIAPALLLAGGAARAQQGTVKPTPLVPPTTVARPVRPGQEFTVSRPVQATRGLFRNVIVEQWDEDLGVSVAQVDETLRAQLNLPEKQGLIVTGLRPFTPAAKAGLKRHDILLTAAERPLATVEDLIQSHRHDTGPDQPLKLKLLRGGKERTVEVGPIERVQTRSFIRRTPQPTSWVTYGDGYFIGITTEPVDAALRSHLEIPEGKGLVVLSTEPGGPAAKAGVKPHDVLLAFGDKELADEGALRAAIQESKGKGTPLKLLRGGKALTVEVTPAKRENVAEAARWQVTALQSPEEYWVGLPATPVGAALREHLGLAGGKGLIVGDVPAESPAAKAGFKKHDILLKAGEKDLKDEGELRAAVQEAKDKPITFTLLRAGKEMTLAVTPEKRPAMYSGVSYITPNLQLFGPGVLTGQPNPPLTVNPAMRDQWREAVQAWARSNAAAGSDAVQKKLDDLSAQIERLTKAVEDLRAALPAEGAGKK